MLFRSGNLESTGVRNVSGRRTRSSRAAPTFTAEELELVEKAARNKRRIEKMILEQTRILEQKNEKDKSVDVFESISIKNSKDPSRPVAAWMGQNSGDPDPGGDPDRNDDFDNWNPPFRNRRGGGSRPPPPDPDDQGDDGGEGSSIPNDNDKDSIISLTETREIGRAHV